MGNEVDLPVADVPVREQLGDVQWVYQNYANEEISEGDAPSPGAWGLLQACRGDRNAYLKVLERVHPRDAGLAGEESSAMLLELDARVQKEWGALAGVLELACRRPEFAAPLAEFAREWKRQHPAKMTERQADMLSRLDSNTMEPDERPL